MTTLATFTIEITSCLIEPSEECFKEVSVFHLSIYSFQKLRSFSHLPANQISCLCLNGG